MRLNTKIVVAIKVLIYYLYHNVATKFEEITQMNPVGTSLIWVEAELLSVSCAKISHDSSRKTRGQKG